MKITDSSPVNGSNPTAMRALAATLAIALLLLGVAVPLVLCALFVLALPLVAAAVGPIHVRCAEQPVALRALVLFRGPPSLV